MPERVDLQKLLAAGAVPAALKLILRQPPQPASKAETQRRLRQTLAQQRAADKTFPADDVAAGIFVLVGPVWHSTVRLLGWCMLVHTLTVQPRPAPCSSMIAMPADLRPDPSSMGGCVSQFQ